MQSMVRWGIPFGMVTTFGPILFDILYDIAKHGAETPLVLPWWYNLVTAFVISILSFGYLFGQGNWSKNESAYLKLTEDEHSTSPNTATPTV